MTDDQLKTQLTDYMQNTPGAIHGAVFNVAGMNDANKLYFDLEAAYKTMFEELRRDGHIGETSGDVTENFALVGFPRFVHQINFLSHVMIFLTRDIEKKTWTTELMFHYIGDSTIVYRTQILA